MFFAHATLEVPRGPFRTCIMLQARLDTIIRKRPADVLEEVDSFSSCTLRAVKTFRVSQGRRKTLSNRLIASLAGMRPSCVIR